ncbi:MAG TPA: transposase zinc-binding domain-containing protein [Vicinamibacteria bacterium]|nr:transposase zinc-binding domain-containing protein [Vicinamibacteria bacterium]
MEITCRVYKPRRPRESPLFRLVEQHLEELLRVWPTRFVRQHGPLRPVVERVLRDFLKCGLLEHGLARRWCSECRRSVLVAFSCRGRSFCPSCEKKKQLLWAEWLREELLARVPHRHVVLTIPRLLRPLLRRRRDLLTELARAGAEATVELVRRGAGRDLRPGLVVSVATAGDLLQWHPHLHLLTTAGGFAPNGRFVPLPEWDAALLMGLFRERILARLLDRHAISRELVQKLLGWRHPGFSAHVGESIAAQERQRLEDTAAYLVRNPLSLRKLVYLDGQQAVLYRSRMNPSLGRNFEALDPLEWLARMSDHIPDPGQHRTVFHGQYANRARGAGRRDAAQMPEASTEPPRRRSSPTWARLIARIYQVDPLVCTRCGRKMQMIAFLTDQLSIKRILDHLGLSEPPQDKPPPVREVLRVAEQGEGWGVPAEWS